MNENDIIDYKIKKRLFKGDFSNKNVGFFLDKISKNDIIEDETTLKITSGVSKPTFTLRELHDYWLPKMDKNVKLNFLNRVKTAVCFVTIDINKVLSYLDTSPEIEKDDIIENVIISTKSKNTPYQERIFITLKHTIIEFAVILRSVQ